MKVIGILQARMNSTRLPGKVLMDLNGEPVLWQGYKRLLKCEELSQVVVSIGEENHGPIEEFCEYRGMAYEIGPEADLIERHFSAASTRGADAIVRVTADEPLIDPSLVDNSVRFFKGHWPRYEYVHNWDPECEPHGRTWPDGMDHEVISMRFLGELSLTKECPREDYNTWVIKRKTHYKTYFMRLVGGNYGQHRLTLDTQEDHDKLTSVLKKAGNDCTNWRAFV